MPAAAGRAIGWAALLLFLLPLLAGCSPAIPPVRLCERLVPALVDAPPSATIESSRTEVDGGLVVAAGAGGCEIRCRFEKRAPGAVRWRLAGVSTAAYGELSQVQLVLLLHLLDLPSWEFLDMAGPPAAPPPLTWRAGLLYLLQQSINGVTLGCVYALIAVGYTLVYGIVGVINFAYGEIHMIGAFLAIIAFALIGAAGVSSVPLALLVVLVASMALTAAYGWVAERTISRPMRGASPVTPLVAAIGLSIFLQEYVRLLQGARLRWLPPVMRGGRALIERDGFAVHVGDLQVLTALASVGLGAAVWLLLARSGFGRAQRACAQDRRMAALLGVDVDRTVALTFMLGAALAAAAGVIVAVYYGGVGFFMGYLIGFKALTAAVLGGIGSLPGALLGGLAIGLIETYWSAYLDLQYKDVAVFSLLVLVLVFRPTGLIGLAESRLVRDRL